MLQHFAVSNVVEVRGTEDGFLGSWYAARVLEAREARSNVKLRLCYEAFQEDDGSKWEDWIEARRSPMRPPQPHAARRSPMRRAAAPGGAPRPSVTQPVMQPCVTEAAPPMGVTGAARAAAAAAAQGRLRQAAQEGCAARAVA